MGYRVNPNWLADRQEEWYSTHQINTAISYNAAAQALIEWLAKQNIPFKVYNMGAGVKKITTETDTCPCCRRKL